MCLDQGEAGFVKTCIERGIHYIDISASYPFLVQVEQLDAFARERGATGVLSVGLAPGLTNLLAKRCKDVFDELQRVDIAILLGLGEAHGKAAIQWTVDNIDARFAVPCAEEPKQVSSFADPKPARFPGGYGWRKTYRFNFADQHVVARTLNIDRISTRLCFDSAVVTHLLALCSKAHLFRMLRIAGAQRPLAALISRLHVGSDVFAVKVDAEGMIKNEPYAYACSISGRREGYVTGVVAALVAERVYTSSFRSGIFHIEQLFDPLALFAQIADRGFAVDLGLPQRVGRATETSQKKGDRHSPPR
jgi:saccharopine dehydrogenase-like NADP-dependent oxidoreductase